MARIEDTGAGRASNGRSGDGIGPTLGPDVSPEHEMEEDARAAREKLAFSPSGTEVDEEDLSTARVNRSRQQGLGVGQEELDRQRDPKG